MFHLSSQTTACFPNITNHLNQYYERISGYETTYTNLILDVAHKKFIAKNLLIQAEDARLYNEYSYKSNFMILECFDSIHKYVSGMI